MPVLPSIGRLRCSARSLVLASHFAVIAIGPLGAAVAQPTPASLPVRPGTGGDAEATARLVGSIVAYTRWPKPLQTVQLCVVGPADHADRLGEGVLVPGLPPVRRRDLSPDVATIADTCDVVYLGRLPLPLLRRITAATRGNAVVTIAEADLAGQSEAMFCLDFAPGALSFRMNIDAISRSGVRIDPRILRLSREVRR